MTAPASRVGSGGEKERKVEVGVNTQVFSRTSLDVDVGPYAQHLAPQALPERLLCWMPNDFISRGCEGTGFDRLRIHYSYLSKDAQIDYLFKYW